MGVVKRIVNREDNPAMKLVLRGVFQRTNAWVYADKRDAQKIQAAGIECTTSAISATIDKDSMIAALDGKVANIDELLDLVDEYNLMIPFWRQ